MGIHASANNANSGGNNGDNNGSNDGGKNGRGENSVHGGNPNQQTKTINPRPLMPTFSPKIPALADNVP